jgi:type IX secretion system PorP/SprF family membrane protein
LLAWPVTVVAQQVPTFTQYFNNPLILNPAIAGTRNALAMDVSTRQQWMGVKDAPKSYYMVAHSPINRSKISLGASLLADKAGPVSANHFSLAYSYLARINHRMFLSFGLNTGVNNYSIGLNDLNLIDGGDPFFERNITNGWKPTFGSGLIVFTPAWYLSLSVPQIQLDRFKNESDDVVFQSGRNYYLSAGYYFFMADGYNMKLSMLSRIAEKGTSAHDINSYFTLKDNFNVGLTYRLNSAAAVTLGAQITPTVGICYSYDFPMHGTKYHSINNQEITLSFDISTYFVRNRDREFLRKKPAEEMKSIKSIRYF